MPSKLRKALGAVKDQTSISLAKVTNAAALEVAILKATTHDEIPMDDRYVTEIVQIVSSNKVYAAACAQSIGKRIGKTRNWVVALKSLMLVLRIFQDGDPYFPREVFHAMKRGAKILNLSSFRDDSTSSPWDYTAFIRTFALYLDERLDCFLTGKLQRRFTYHNQIREKNQRHKLSNDPGIKDMKPTMLLDRISYWQRLLDRAIGARPTGLAKTNRLVQISLYAVVQESFDLYRDISDGLGVILDNFFQLSYQACFTAFQACLKSSKQFDDLSAFYSLCSSIGVGRTSEYPSVQKVSEELMETLHEFLKDQASFPENTGRSPLSKFLLSSVPKDPSSSSGQDEAQDRYGTPESFCEGGFEYGSQCTSLEDLMSATDAASSPRRSLEQDMYSDQSEQEEKQSQNEDYASANDSGSSHSLPIDQTGRSSLDILSFDDFQQEEQQYQTNEQEQENITLGVNNGPKDCWEIVLAKTTSTTTEQTPPFFANEFDPFVVDTLFDQSPVLQHQYNPFLEDLATAAPSIQTNLTISTQENQDYLSDLFDAAPPFLGMAPPTFCAQSPSGSGIAMEPTFSAQSFNSETNSAQTFGDHLNSSETSLMAPTFNARWSFAETNMAVTPTFHAQNVDDMTAAQAIYAHDPFEISSAPTFRAHNSNETSTASTFSSQNLAMTMATPSFVAQSSLVAMIHPTFRAQSFDETMAAPTFRTEDFNERTAAAQFQFEDDPFGPWPSAMNSEHTSNMSMQQQSLLQEQQLWLEQQKKIIAKRMT